jgi:hypothetical protein
MNDIVEEMRQMIGNDGIQEGLTTDVVYYRFFVALSMVIFRFLIMINIFPLVLVHAEMMN